MLVGTSTSLEGRQKCLGSDNGNLPEGVITKVGEVSATYKCTLTHHKGQVFQSCVPKWTLCEKWREHTKETSREFLEDVVFRTFHSQRFRCVTRAVATEAWRSRPSAEKKGFPSFKGSSSCRKIGWTTTNLIHMLIYKGGTTCHFATPRKWLVCARTLTPFKTQWFNFVSYIMLFFWL